MKSVESWQTEKDDNKEIDIVMGKNIVLSSEIEKIRLRLENKLRLFFNEWFLHKNEGIYWIKRNENNGQIGNLLEKFNIETQVKETILADEDVVEITKFESDFKNGTNKLSQSVVLSSSPFNSTLTFPVFESIALTSPAFNVSINLTTCLITFL